MSSYLLSVVSMGMSERRGLIPAGPRYISWILQRAGLQ